MYVLNPYIFEAGGGYDQTIKINLRKAGDSTTTVSDGTWNEGNVAWDTLGSTIADMIDDTGALTGVGIEVVTPFSLSELSFEPADTGFPQPIQVYRREQRNFWNSANVLLRLSGLDNAKVYDISAQGYMNDVSYDTTSVMTIGAASDSYIAERNISDIALIENVSPSLGVIDIEFSNPNDGTAFVAYIIIKRKS